MPTVRTVTVKPSGGDYTSLAAAIAGECPSGTNLVSLDRQLNIECHAMLDLNNRVVLSGVTDDATRYIRIYAAQAHGGVWNTGAYRYEITTGFGGWFNAFVVDVDYTRIEGLQLSMVPDTAFRTVIGSFSAAFAKVRYVGNLIRIINGSVTGSTGITTTQDGFTYVVNNIIYQTGTASGDGIVISALTFNGGAYVYNNTVYGFNNGMIKYAGLSIVAKNNLVQSCTTCYGSSYDGTSTGNVSEDSSSPNASLRNLSATFVDEGNFDFHLASGDTAAIGNGDDLSADSVFPFTTDIDGATRSSWDSGADEFSGTPTPTPTPTIAQIGETAYTGSGGNQAGAA